MEEYSVEKYGEKKQFSEQCQEFMKEKLEGKDIYSLSLEELKQYKDNLEQLIEENNMLELASKLLGNAAYGASANRFFYFYNMNVASSITKEARNLTQFMWNRLEKFFHEDIWERKDLWEKFGFELDPSKKNWFSTQTVSTYSDTDSGHKNMLFLIDKDKKMTFTDLFNMCKDESGINHTSEHSQEFVLGNGHTVKNYKDGKIVDVPIKYVMRHHTNKKMYKIQSKSGKETIVTEDHSCVVFRDGKQIVVKSKDIDQSSDILLVVINENEFQFEGIESIECLGLCEDDYVYDIEVEDNTHTFIGDDILVHNSVYTSYGTFFKCWTEESLKKVPTRDDKINWILKFNQEFLDKQNEKWMNEMYDPRHCHSIHKFELETVSESTITLKKKKYLKAMSYSKGKWFTPSKITGVGIELIKSTSPKLAKEIITDMTRSLVYEYPNMEHEEYALYFNHKLAKWKKKFWCAPIEDISQSINVGNYKKYVLCDEGELLFAKQTPVSVKSAARFNYLAKKNNQRNIQITQGQKIKYYNIRLGGTKKHPEMDYFGYPSGEIPSWAPECDKATQWQKNVLDPLNRFLEVMKLPLLNGGGTVQFNLFGS